MADLPTGFWSGWIIVITLFSLAMLAWLAVSIYFGADGKVDPDSEPVWDKDLREGANTPPMWWFWLLLGSMVFSLIYLMLYPGMGSYTGLLNWSQGRRLIESYENFDQNFEEIRAEIAATSLLELQNDLDLMQVAERIFTRECSACHGPEARGQASLFPNLMDIDWQWGSSPEQIEQSIRSGRSANMLAWSAVLDEKSVNEIGDYVLLLGEPGAESHAGKAQYEQNCSACHGVDGSGNPLLGAPNLTDDIWLYGGDISSVRISIGSGRNGIMPAFDARLDNTQISLLVAMLAR